MYMERITELRQQISLLNRKKRNLGFGRLVSFLAAILLFFTLLATHPIAAVIVAIISLLTFLMITLRDIENTRHLRHKERLLDINEGELNALDHHFDRFPDGHAFFPKDHDYVGDLDVLGPHSLFQYINRCSGEPSASLLARRLLYPEEADKIPLIQEAVRELQPEIDWRQQLGARGQAARVTQKALEQITQWSDENEALPREQKIFQWLTILLPILTLGAIVLADYGVISWSVLWISFWAHLVLVWRVNRATAERYEKFSEAIKVMDAFNGVLETLLDKPFHSTILKALQDECRFEGEPAPRLFKKLKGILDRMDLRLNPLVHFPLNLAVFWDWHQFRQLQCWKRQHPNQLTRWLDVFGEMEVLASFANMAFNHPSWCFPRITAQHFTFSAKDLGHPLLADDKRISNDIGLEGTGKILLVTGSNMAGKSTFLRTVGVNMILAMAGGPVCASDMILAPIRVLSSMRIADNLEENISTFYAELRKLEHILTKVRHHEKVFLLLDEILRGTNSMDRHAGASALIRSFIEEDTVGILATHDLALTEMEKEFPDRLLNYHFDVQVRGEELFFDYRLKAGICSSMNASLLMRKIGIRV